MKENSISITLKTKVIFVRIINKKEQLNVRLEGQF